MKITMAKILLLLSLLMPYHSIRAESASADISQHNHETDNESDTDNDDVPETHARKKKKVKKFCKVCAQCLSVCGNITDNGTLTSNGPLVANDDVTINGSLTINGTPFPIAPTYGYIYDISSNTVFPGNPVPFNMNGPLSGITHTPGSSQITIQNTGVYTVLWSALNLYSSVAYCQIYINGVPAPSTIYIGGFFTGTGIAILPLSAGDMIELVAIAGLEGSDNPYEPLVDASILIQKIS